MGVLDRVLRVALGTVAATAAGTALDGGASLLAWGVAIDALITGTTGFSLLYDTFDLDTRSAEAQARPGRFAA